MNTRANDQEQQRFFDKAIVPQVPIDVNTQIFRHPAFPTSGPHPWLDGPDALAQIDAKLESGEITPDEAVLCRKWVQDGYLIIERFFSEEQLDATWAAYEDAIASGKVTPPQEPLFDGDALHGRVLNPHFKVEKVREILFDKRMADIVSLLLGVRALPFQTIIGHKSSEQLQHSDYIHMSTYPTGFLAANWIAFEDIDPESGPLVYHPGSHKLPYLLSDELGIPHDVGYAAYHKIYEPAIQKLIVEHNLETKYFHPKKGDVLLWHANLLHGGSKMRDNAKVSRKALVCHFFAQGATCFHDLTGMPAHVTPIEFDEAGYLEMYPDVAAAGAEPLWHYIMHGRFEGRLPGRIQFDAEAYLAANPDVAAAGIDALAHYLANGRAEGRPLTPATSE